MHLVRDLFFNRFDVNRLQSIYSVFMITEQFPKMASSTTTHTHLGCIRSLAVVNSQDAQAEHVLTGHDSGAVELWVVRQSHANANDAPLSNNAANAVSALGFRQGLGAPVSSIASGTPAGAEIVVVAGDLRGRLAMMPLRQAQPGEALARSSVATGWRQVSSVDMHASAPAMIAAGDGISGRVAYYSAAGIASNSSGSNRSSDESSSSNACKPLWESSLAGGCGPPISCVRWWPFSQHTLAAAGGKRVALFDMRAPPPSSPSERLRSIPSLVSQQRSSIDSSESAGSISVPYGQPSNITSIAFSPEDPWSCFGGTDGGHVLSWDVRRPGLPVAISQPSPSVLSSRRRRSSGAGLGPTHGGPVWGVAHVPSLSPPSSLFSPLGPSSAAASNGAAAAMASPFGLFGGSQQAANGVGADDGTAAKRPSFVTVGDDGAVIGHTLRDANEGSDAEAPSLELAAMHLARLPSGIGGLKAVAVTSRGTILAGGDGGALLVARSN